MEAAKELHDAIYEASMARRHDSAGWILLHPGGPVPDTYASVMIANVIASHIDLVPAIAALRKAAKSNWVQGRRAWGAGGVKFQLVKQGDPGHKGHRHYVWVNVAARESTTTERAIQKNSKTLQTTESSLQCHDARMSIGKTRAGVYMQLFKCVTCQVNACVGLLHKRLHVF